MERQDPPAPFAKGDRIRLVHMSEDPHPIPAGTEGTVTRVSYVSLPPAGWQVSVDWDNGRGLMLYTPPDRAVKIG